MISKEETENKDMILAMRIKRIFDYIEDEIKEKGEISQFKEDVLCVIHELLEKQLSKEELTACEIVVKNEKAYLQHEKERKMQEYIQQLENENRQLKNTQQKVTEKLEKDYESCFCDEKHKGNFRKARWQDEYAEEILKIMKGEE